jgi:hypothetical protein
MHIDRRAGRLLGDRIFEGPDDELLTTEQLAREWFDCSTQKLEKDRTRGPP